MVGNIDCALTLKREWKGKLCAEKKCPIVWKRKPRNILHRSQWCAFECGIDCQSIRSSDIYSRGRRDSLGCSILFGLQDSRN